MLIKICGLMDPDLAKFAVKQGADYIGLLFSKVSTRSIGLEKAKEIVDAVKSAGGEPVAVFADETLEQMLAIIEALDLKIVQLHGDVPRSFCDALSVQKIYVADGKSLPKSLDPKKDFLLFENHFENPKGFRFFIAGNLKPENVCEAISRFNPEGIDASRGVREPDTITAFIEKSRPGRFGTFGGMYVPELLVQPLKELDHAFQTISIDDELVGLLHHYAGRPTAITEVPNFSKAINGLAFF